ncbi:MAG: tetratricopeptide repeat protein, partial [Polyangiales bacterium]
MEITWAFRFMERLYTELAKGRDLDDAFCLTRADQPDGDPQWALPLLYRRLSDPGAMQTAVTRRAATVGLESMSERPALKGLLPPRQARPYFVAREAELDALTRWVKQPGAAVISAVEGEGGIGKTELALKVADETQKAGRPVLWLERADTDVRAALLALGRTAEPDWRPSPEAPIDDLRGHVRRTLAPYHGLVVLDDVADAAVVDTLTPGSAWNVLVTTRQERLVPGAVPLSLGPLDEAAGLRLLAQMAWRSEEVPAEEREAAAEVVRALAGLPLAIEVAGAAMWQRGQSSAEWLADFRARVGAAADERTRVEAVLLRSLDAVAPEARDALDVLAVAAPAGLDADQVATGVQRSPVATRRHLDALARMHLARWSPATGRYTLHPLVREAMRRRMQDDGARWDAARGAVGRVARALWAWIGEPLSRDAGEGWVRWAQARAQIEGLRLADWGAGTPGAIEVGDAVGSLDQFRQLDTAPEVRLAALDAAMALVAGADKDVEGRILAARGDLRCHHGDLDNAKMDYDRALTLFGDVQNRLGQANVLHARGNLMLRRGDIDNAERNYDRAFTLVSEVQDRIGQANVLKSRGDLRYFRSDLEGAAKDYDCALKLFEEMRDRLGQANVLQRLGDLKLRSRDLDGVEEDYNRALTLFDEARDRLGQANVLHRRGDVRRFRSDFDNAEKDYDRAYELFGEVQSRLGQANVLRARGDLRRTRSDLEGAEKDYNCAYTFYVEEQDRLGQANVLQARGDLAQAREQWDLALRWYNDVLPTYIEIQNRLGASNVHAEFARVYARSGRFEEARASATTAVELGAQCHNRYAMEVA